MTKAAQAQVSWDTQKNGWVIRIQVGEEVVKRPAPKTARNAPESELRSLAVQVAKDEGYDIDPALVTITPATSAA